MIGHEQKYSSWMGLHLILELLQLRVFICVRSPIPTIAIRSQSLANDKLSVLNPTQKMGIPPIIRCHMSLYTSHLPQCKMTLLIVVEGQRHGNASLPFRVRCQEKCTLHTLSRDYREGSWSTWHVNIGPQRQNGPYHPDSLTLHSQCSNKPLQNPNMSLHRWKET